jgi:hypothetical protein
MQQQTLNSNQVLSYCHLNAPHIIITYFLGIYFNIPPPAATLAAVTAITTTLIIILLVSQVAASEDSQTKFYMHLFSNTNYMSNPSQFH